MRRIGLHMGTQGTHSSFSPPASVARPLWPWNTPSTNGHNGKHDFSSLFINLEEIGLC